MKPGTKIVITSLGRAPERSGEMSMASLPFFETDSLVVSPTGEHCVGNPLRDAVTVETIDPTTMTDDDRLQEILRLVQESDDPFRLGDLLAASTLMSNGAKETSFFGGFWEGASK